MSTTGCLSNVLENEVLDHVFGVGSYSPPATVYLALSTADPLDDFSGIAEPVGNGYVRKAITFNAASSRQVVQTSTVTFDQASGPWGTISHWAIYTLSSGGVGMARGALSTSKSIVSGNTPSVNAGEVIISFPTGNLFNYLAHKILDWLFRAQAFSMPSIYAALSTTIPNDDGTNITEPSGNGYAREAVATWNTASGGATANTNAITMDTATGSWGTVVFGVLFDQLTSGNALMRGDITDQAVGVDDVVEWPAGDFDVTLD